MNRIVLLALTFVAVLVATLAYLHSSQRTTSTMDQPTAGPTAGQSTALDGSIAISQPSDPKPIPVEEQKSVAASHNAAVDAAELAARAAGQTSAQ